MDSRVEKASFTPSEAQALTGVDVALQRRWRKEKYLPDNQGGWTRYGPKELAHLAVLGRLARLVGPAAALKMMDGTPGENAAVVTYFHMAVQPGASVGVHVVPTGKRYAISDGSLPFRFEKTLSASELCGDLSIVLDLEKIGSDLAKAVGRPFQILREDEA